MHSSKTVKVLYTNKRCKRSAAFCGSLITNNDEFEAFSTVQRTSTLLTMKTIKCISGK